jgi:hypothetical protein
MTSGKRNEAKPGDVSRGITGKYGRGSIVGI